MKIPRVHDFDPNAKKTPVLASSLDNMPTIQKPQATPQRVTEQGERPNAPTPERANVRRIITRNSFEIYEDQMEALRKLSYTEKMEGKLGSMSQMVRTAIDEYLQKKAAEK